MADADGNLSEEEQAAMNDAPEENQEPEFPLPIASDLTDDYRRLRNLVRGNERMEDQLIKRGKQLDLSALVLNKLDLLLDETLGEPEQSRKRLDFEIAFAERIRQMLTAAFNLR